MRIFVAGATGVIGRPLVAALLGAAKARAELGFAPRFPRWREGFAAVFAASPEQAATAA